MIANNMPEDSLQILRLFNTRTDLLKLKNKGSDFGTLRLYAD